MEVEILKDKWCEMKKLVKNREIQHSSQSWYIRNTLSMNELTTLRVKDNLKWK